MTPSESLAGFQLARGVVRGLWSLEQLDRRSAASQDVENDRQASAHPDSSRPPWEAHDGPAMPYPGAGTVAPYRNLARDWIAANPDAWTALQSGDDTAAQAIGTAASREKARQIVADYDRLVDSGYDFNANLHDGRIHLPDVIHGPVGYRPPWHPAWKAPSDGLSPIGRAAQDADEVRHAA